MRLLWVSLFVVVVVAATALIRWRSGGLNIGLDNVPPYPSSSPGTDISVDNRAAAQHTLDELRRALSS